MIPVKISVMLQKETSSIKLPITLLSIFRECALIMIDSRTKKLIQDTNFLMSSMSMTTLLQNKKVFLNKTNNLLIN